MYTYEQRQEIKVNYGKFNPEKRSPYSYSPRCGFKMTPIEQNVWNEIRSYGLPFYPEFPVLDYFIDFADPVRKIGLEVDGKEWHKDIEKDAIRQYEIEKEGWKIFRIKGNETFHDISFEQESFLFDPDYRERYLNFSGSEYYCLMCDLIKKYRGIDLQESNQILIETYNSGYYY